MGIPTDVFPFLTDLACHNNREWFHDNKTRFQQVQNSLLDYVADLITQLAVYEPRLFGLDAKNCVFRIHKDARFARDGAPYKTHLGVHLVDTGKRSDFHRAGFYVHLEPNHRSFLGGGAHAPSPTWLKQIRTRLQHEGHVFERIIQASEFKQYFGGIQGERLIRAPQGFLVDTPYIDWIKYKTLWVQHEVDDGLAASAQWDEYVCCVFQAYQSLQQFLNR